VFRAYNFIMYLLMQTFSDSAAR